MSQGGCGKVSGRSQLFALHGAIQRVRKWGMFRLGPRISVQAKCYVSGAPYCAQAASFFFSITIDVPAGTPRPVFASVIWETSFSAGSEMSLSAWSADSRDMWSPAKISRDISTVDGH